MTATVLDETNSIVIEPNEYGFPPLMIVATGHVGPDEFEAARMAYQACVKQGLPMMFSGDFFKVFQLIDGRWQRLD